MEALILSFHKFESYFKSGLPLIFYSQFILFMGLKVLMLLGSVLNDYEIGSPHYFFCVSAISRLYLFLSIITKYTVRCNFTTKVLLVFMNWLNVIFHIKSTIWTKVTDITFVALFPFKTVLDMSHTKYLVPSWTVSWWTVMLSFRNKIHR